MANIDMCEHDWPGSGCIECFPSKSPEKGTEPKEPGYYWVKLFHSKYKPQIVYVNEQFVVFACGDRNRYSFNEDVKEWCSGKVEL